METPRTSFPFAEGVGIFVGVIAWDLLSEGQVDIVKALLITIPCTLAWFGLRFCRGKTRESGKQDKHSNKHSHS